ncbi:hypothetical protein Cpir12675_003563 [Ceratocystis pirilliformis]|uniref:Sulfate transporter family protein n=1 Tax=Ceratocystis pirilliformis TaxID=259994 RepID=A0ABR3Z1Z3_9PEZI
MSSFSSWRNRASSVNAQDHPETAQYGSITDAANGSRAKRQRSNSFSVASVENQPMRSFVTGAGRNKVGLQIDSSENARSVRQDTADLASYFLADRKEPLSTSFLARQRSVQNTPRTSLDEDRFTAHISSPHLRSPNNQNTQWETDSEADPELDALIEDADEGPSVLSNMLRRSPPDAFNGAASTACVIDDGFVDNSTRRPRSGTYAGSTSGDVETTPLLGVIRRGSMSSRRSLYGSSLEDHIDDIEAQKLHPHSTPSRVPSQGANIPQNIAWNPTKWDYPAIYHNAVIRPAHCLPAVIVGLLLNILDALSYGMILFPLASPIFSQLGSAGISIFYVSTIISQLTFSTGSIFRGGVGSELIEVVPFFHNMAGKITRIVGEDKPEEVIATTIVAFSASSIVTGLVFWMMGKFQFGYMVGFIPRHILIGCIGGVGFFLILTGFEVSARLDGGVQYDLETLRQLMDPETLWQWVIPFFLAIALFWGHSKVKSKYFLPLYILGIPFIFYFFVLTLDQLNVDSLRDSGWIFVGPPSGEPWWYFYTLYQFNLVHWDAVASCFPAMLALTFFGVLHVPINVPALALNIGEDNADLDVELKLHGYSNLISGMLGSIQNYLVYANSVFFMRSGGDSRLAGFMLAGLTFCVMIAGPALIGFIPVMMVGCLIFDLGFELLLDAVWVPRRKLKMAEYLTVLAIVLIMGIYDFVVGIGVGVMLAFVSLIFQTASVPAIRATYSGDIVTSTVRRNPSQHHYLQQAGQQISIVKLAGYLFFGTIVSVEEKIRELLDDKAFSARPIRYLIVDMRQVTGLDYSAVEAFNTIGRLIKTKNIELIVSGVDPESQLGRNLRSVGLVGPEGMGAALLPDLNSALESCENELLKTFYASHKAMSLLHEQQTESTPRLVPPLAGPSRNDLLDMPQNSPRRALLQQAAQVSLTQTQDHVKPKKWVAFKEPLRLMLRIFNGISDKNEDFWFRALPYFVKREHHSGERLYERGEPADGFYLVENGIIRVEYDLPQGFLSECIVAGTTCGELPFFSETPRTATAVVERDCTIWILEKSSWEKMQKNDADVARELLRISLKLTSERMSSITAYILTTANIRAILGGTHKVRKSQVSPGPSPRRRTLSSSSHRSSRLSNLGRPLSTSHTPGQEQPTTVLAAISAVRESMFTSLSLESHAARTMPSTQIARVLAFQRRAAPIVNTSHVRHVLPDATAAIRQIAEALATGTVRRIIVTRSRRWEGLVCLADLEALVRGEQLLGDKTTPPVTEDTANSFLVWVRSGDTCGGLTRSQEDDLVRAGFLAAPTIREWTRHSGTASWNPQDQQP